MYSLQVCAGIAGIVPLGTCLPRTKAATGFDTYAIAAAIIGGTLLEEKENIWCSSRCLIIGVINYGMTVLTVPSLSTGCTER